MITKGNFDGSKTKILLTMRLISDLSFLGCVLISVVSFIEVVVDTTNELPLRNQTNTFPTRSVPPL